MSLYSTVLKPDYIDPRIDVQNKRVEFRLNPSTAYESNLRIVNLGYTIGANDSQLIIGTAGLYSQINNIRLMDGGKEIDACRNANRYLAFKNMNNSNVDNYNITQQTAKAEVGYILNASKKVITGQESNRVLRTAANQTDEFSGYLDLRACFPILENIPYLDTSLMPNLRIEIELNNNSNLLIDSNTNDALSTLRPLLIADEILDEQRKAKLKASLKNVGWNAVEHDLVSVPSQEAVQAAAGFAAGTVQTQEVSLRVNGYDNKIVGRVLMAKVYSDKTKYATAGNTTLGLGELSSVAQFQEKINLKVNGRAVMSGDGLDTPAKKLAVLADTFGDVNISPYSHLLACGQNSPNARINKYGIDLQKDANNESDSIGMADYVGLEVSQRISQLTLEYSRGIIKDAAVGNRNNESAGLDIHIFAEVPKVLIVEGGDYEIKYL